MKCDTCGFKYAVGIRITYTDSGDRLEYCDHCGDARFDGMPDVYLGGSGLQTDPNIVDPKTGKEVPFSSKREKQAIMKDLGIEQAQSSERHHGYRSRRTKRTYFT